MSNKFKVTAPAARPVVDQKKLEAFANNAAGLESKPTHPTIEPPPLSTGTYSDRSKGLLLRLLPEQFDRLEKVFAHSSYKSKQTMGEKLLMDAIEDLAKKLGI